MAVAFISSRVAFITIIVTCIAATTNKYDIYVKIFMYHVLQKWVYYV